MTRRRPTASTRLRRLQWAVSAFLVLALAVAGALYAKGEAIVLGAEAYIFGYPLVVMDVTRHNLQRNVGPDNQLRRVRVFPGARFREVVRPNVDTLYTTAFIDMHQGPWVFEMPANDQRYELMPFMDAWTNVFASPGTRSTGTTGGRFLLAGPAWTGPTPEGLTLLRAPTRMVWLIGRTQANGGGDLPMVHHLQDGIRLRTLGDWKAGVSPAPPAWDAAPDAGPTPVRQMQGMDTPAFFLRLAQLMVDNPPAAADGPMLVKLARIGVMPGQPPRWSLTDRWAISLGRTIADWTVARELRKRRTVDGWNTPPGNIGDFGTFYNLRAVVAMIGLGANLAADATYPSAATDNAGRTLHGDHRYRLHFAKGGLPPVRAFWSVTAYGADDYLIGNPLGRHALGDRDPLQFNPDGSLDLWIQAEAPERARQANWLPVKAGEPFLLNARLYWPKAAALDGSWGMPGVERQD